MPSSSAPLPLVSLAVRAPLIGGARAVERERKRIGNPALDLDLAPGSPARMAARAPAMSAFAALAPTSIWLPERSSGAAGAAPGHGVDLPASWLEHGPPLIVIDLPPLPEGRFVDFVQIASAAEHYRRSSGGAIALGLRARHLEGGRRHLARLTLLRRSLEEWGLGVALDLSGPFDPQWEAEAAILRLAGRVALIRVGTLALSPAAVDRSRVARRALRTAFEVSPTLPVALSSSRRWWQRFGQDNAADWIEATARMDGYRIEARHIELPPRWDSTRSPNQSNPSGLV
jgi:hypothetical protein